MASLDEFKFRSNASETVFSVPVNVAKLSGLFNEMITSPTGTDNESVVLGLIRQHDENRPDYYFTINSTELLRFVYEYMLIWKDKPEKANYIKVQPYQTSEPEQLLSAEDLQFIRRYLDKSLSSIKDNLRTGYEDFDLERYETDPTYVRDITIKMLGELLCQVDEFLAMDCLSNKIYAYISTIIWNTTYVDLATALRNDDFRSIQEKAIAEWKANNVDLATYAKSRTADT